MLDFFKLYAKEVGINAILGDSFMMIIACLFTSYMANIKYKYKYYYFSNILLFYSLHDLL